MKKNGVKLVVGSYKNGVKTEAVHSDICAKTVNQHRLEKDPI